MKTTILALAVIAVLVPMAVYAQDATKPVHVISNDDNSASGGNTATVFSFNQTTGVLKQVKVLKTGGTGIGGGFFTTYNTAVAHNDACIFVLNTASSDITAFKGPAGKYAKVGQYSNSAVSSDADGGSLALTNNGKYLYATYSASENFAGWSVGSDCSLKFLTTYTDIEGADLYGPLKLAPNGKVLVVPAFDFQAADAWTINATTGALKDLGGLVWTSISQCSSGGCFPFGIAFTADSKVVLFGNPSIANDHSLLSASLGPKGLSNAGYYDMTNTANVNNGVNPVLDSSCTKPAVACSLYYGFAGYPADSEQSGEATVSFTEKPLKVKVTSSVAITTPSGYEGTIAQVGKWLIVDEFPNQFGVYAIGKAGKLGKFKTYSNAQGVGMMGFSVF